MFDDLVDHLTFRKARSAHQPCPARRRPARRRKPSSWFGHQLCYEQLEARSLLSASSLDPTFGGGGTILTPIGTGGENDTAEGSALLPDGQMIVVGSTTSSSGATDFAILLYNANGSRDTNFGNQGVVISSFDPGNDGATCVAVQSNGDFVVGGYATVSGTSEFAMARYTETGTLDTTFGNGNGYVLTQIGSTARINSLALQSNGQIVAGGNGVSGSTQDFALARYNTDGSLDTTFGGAGTGYVLTQIESGADTINSVAIRSDGVIVAGGQCGETDAGIIQLWHAAIAWYTPAGVISSQNFDALDITNNDSINSIAVEANNDVIFTGFSSPGGTMHTLVGRYTASGGLDASFGSTGGWEITDIGSADDGTGIALDAEQRIVIISTANINGQDQVAFARYSNSGGLDPNFSSTGTDIGSLGSAGAISSSLLIDANGRIVGFGTGIGNKSGTDFGAIRLGTAYDQEGNTLYLHGTAGNDTLVLATTNSGNNVAFLFNGQFSTYALGSGSGQVDQIVFQAGAGSNTITVTDNYLTDTISAYPSSLTLSNSKLTLTSTGTNNQYVYGTAADVAELFDVSGSNNFVNTGTYSMFSGSGWFNEVAGVGTVTGYAASGTTDTAYFYGVSGSKVVETPTYTALSTASLHLQANNFGDILALSAGDGSDSLYLYGVTGAVDAFCGTQLYSYVSGSDAGSTFFNVGEYFQHVFAYGGGGNDYAYFYDAPGGSNSFIGTSTYSTMSGTSYSNTAYGFAYTLGVGSSSSTDTATIYDAAGTNNFFEAGSYGLMVSATDQISVTGIGTVTAVDQNGSDDHKYAAAIDYNLQFIGNWA